MDWQREMEAEWAALKRIVALLHALANLAELAGNRSPAVRGFVLWLLRHAETAARDFVIGAPPSMPVGPAGNSHGDAMRLARNFRDLARELDSQAALEFAVYADEIGKNDPAQPGAFQALRLSDVLNVANALAFLTCRWDTLRPACFPDTS